MAAAVQILKKEVQICTVPISPIRFMRKIYRITKFDTAAMDVASANPPIFNGHINMTLRRTFMISETAAALTGVRVSPIE